MLYYPEHINAKVGQIFAKALAPCRLIGSCPQSKFEPSSGYVPRGYRGACGSLEEVRAVLVEAHPGNPLPNERYEELTVAKVVETAVSVNEQANDLHHRKLNFVLGLYGIDHWRRVLRTNARLCSLDELGNVSGEKGECAREYLAKVLKILPNAKVIAFGSKAQHRLVKAAIPYIPAISLSPPGCNRRGARDSWIRAVEQSLAAQ